MLLFPSSSSSSSLFSPPIILFPYFYLQRRWWRRRTGSLSPNQSSLPSKSRSILNWTRALPVPSAKSMPSQLTPIHARARERRTQNGSSLLKMIAYLVLFFPSLLSPSFLPLSSLSLSLRFFVGLSSHPDLIRNVAFAGPLHHGKTTFLDMLVQHTHHKDKMEKKGARYTDTRKGERRKRGWERGGEGERERRLRSNWSCRVFLH